MSSAVSSTPMRTSTPASARRLNWYLTTRVSSCFAGGTDAMRSWPPGWSCLSTSTTLWPRRAAMYAASMPAGPAPTTSTFFFSAAGSKPASSCSTSGLTVQEMGLPNMMPFRQRRQPMQGRTSSARPAAALLQNSASHRLARPIMQMSAAPSSMSSSAIQASLMRPTVATGIFTCFLISRERSAWPCRKWACRT